MKTTPSSSKADSLLTKEQMMENPAGDRVVIMMNGKFLPYKSW